MITAVAKTEQCVPHLEGFDAWSDEGILDCLLEGQRGALDAVALAKDKIALAAAAVAERLCKGGRLVYAGAGTSIRVAVQDGAELEATFGLEPARVSYLIAGGKDAIFETLADAEDDAEAGAVAGATCGPTDVLLAVAASGRTPYTCAAARAARGKGAAVVAIVNNPHSELAQHAEIEVCLDSGSEVILGSTRLAAGTAQKIALNLISTLAFTRLGAVHDGLMVNMLPGNSKLQARAGLIVRRIAGVDDSTAKRALSLSKGNIKLAILLCKGVDDVKTAQELMADTQENLRLALSRISAAG